jgi:2-amino-4-hydroxy-6-hydroxymethyldihydropteridine diphosphokinase
VVKALHGYLGLGCNLGDRLAALQQAVHLLVATPQLDVKRLSRVYQSPAWGYQSAHDYYNAVAEISWQGPPRELADQCYRIEAAGGRHRHAARHDQIYHDRLIDIDLLWLAGITSHDERLTLPHPRAHVRAFVLLPWRELAPKLVLGGRTLTGWLAQLPQSEVEAVKPVDDAELVLA